MHQIWMSGSRLICVGVSQVVECDCYLVVRGAVVVFEDGQYVGQQVSCLRELAEVDEYGGKGGAVFCEVERGGGRRCQPQRDAFACGGLGGHSLSAGVGETGAVVQEARLQLYLVAPSSFAILNARR